MAFASPYPDIEIPDVSVPDFILGANADRPDAVALIDGARGDQLTYGQLAAYDDRVAAALHERGLRKGEIIQFERKGYFIFDGEVEGRREFIRIPDGRQASLASKAAGVSTPAVKEEKEKAKTGGEIPVETKMYKVTKVYGEDEVAPQADTKMYKVKNIYDA